jgi:ribosomal protein S18 acetylase RimI-like enzyme
MEQLAGLVAGGRVSFRPMRPDDAACLYEVYASTRTEELAVVDWDEAQKAALLHRQCAAQHQFYQEHYTKTDFLIILRNTMPVGRLYVARWQDEIRIADIALLPPSRNVGIGSAILRDLLAEAAVAHKPVRIHVEQCNPAVRFYERLGFAPIEDKGVYLFMEWSP